MRIPPLLFILLLLLVLTAGSAHALRDSGGSSYSGSATFGVQQFTGESAGVTTKKTALYQQYTVKAQQKGSLYSGRAGSYSLMIGYEFTTLDPTFVHNGVRDPEVTAVNSSKPYYNGTLTLAPGGLPFRLKLFARDTNQTTFLVDNYRDETTSNHLFEPGTYDDILNGTHRTLGGTLLVGIRNGSYLGAYRDVLSQLPRLLVDYKQEEVTDLHHPRNQVHYRVRDLAFISLNKKDNWVHVRMRDYTDFINPNSNTRSEQVMIGTIDQLLLRQWINLTNWLQISGDLSYNVEKKIEEVPVATYMLNMMAAGRRDKVTSAAYLQASRTNDGRMITSTSDIPLSVSVDLNRDTLYRSRFIYASDEASSLDGSAGPTVRANRRSFVLDNQLELLRTQQIKISPQLNLQVLSATEEEGLSMRFATEVASNNRLKRALNWLGGYSLTFARNNDKVTTTSTTLVENEIYGRVDKSLGPTLWFRGSNFMRISTGETSQAVGLLVGSDRTASGSDGKLIQGGLDLSLEQRYQRLGNRLGFVFDFSVFDGVMSRKSALQHMLTYDETMHRLKWNSELVMGETPAVTKSLAVDEKNSALRWSSQGTYNYDPNRSVGLTLIGGIKKQQLGYIDANFSEEIIYRLFTVNGIVRRLAEFSEKIDYEKRVSDSNIGRDRILSGQLEAIFYPTKYFYGKIRGSVSSYLDSNALQRFLYGEAGWEFQKLKVLASYTQANKERESALLPEAMERRWEMKIRKIF